ncbi:aminotransferase [Bradyrhizobium uaiense]|uniref:Aminotransferase n=1 Tax=Bradyrhizobium uaiense TaxID=2594946 RepID=A0A6P1BB40_9BRAD|nr:aminotransferase [Bradyrhizobium uaiense]NEU95625.1 aminotransferase [Bradyrhizobium uaiense]
MHQTNADIRRLDIEHFIHPYTDFATFKSEGSQIAARASGVHVIDENGQRYVDGIAGLWCVNLGHGRREIVDAIAEQAATMQYYNPFGHTTNIPATLLAAELAELLPGSLNHVFYTTGGSTANDLAIRMVHYYFNRRGMPRKKKIISRVDAYHGSTYVTARLTGIHATKYDFDEVAEGLVHHVSAANLYRRPAGMDEAAFCNHLVSEFEDRILQLGPDNVAAFIAEPIMGAGGVMVAPAGYHARMHAICRRYGMLYIADEVVTAFGRLGEWSASETLYGYTPDIMIVAKGLTSGYVPLGAAIFSSEIYDVISTPQRKGAVLSLGFTYTGHAVACAAGRATIAMMKRDDVNQHVRKIGPLFQGLLSSLRSFEVVGDVRGSHLMAGIELVKDRHQRLPFGAEVGAAHRVFLACRRRGLIVRPIGNVVVLSPPLVFSQEDCRETCRIMSEAVEEVTPALLAA